MADAALRRLELEENEERGKRGWSHGGRRGWGAKIARAATRGGWSPDRAVPPWAGTGAEGAGDTGEGFK